SGTNSATMPIAYAVSSSSYALLPPYATATLEPATITIAIRPSASGSTSGHARVIRFVESTLLGARIALSIVDSTADASASTNTIVTAGLRTAAPIAVSVPLVPPTPSRSAASPDATGTSPIAM